MKETATQTLVIKNCDDKFLIAHAEELAELCRRSFQEHAEKGINFGPITMTKEKFAERAVGNIGQYIEHEGKIIAFWNGVPNEKKKTVYGDILAIDPEYKGQHVGLTLAQERAKELARRGYKIYYTDTSLKAKHVVAFHKRYGCKAWGMTHFGQRNYYSVVLRKALVPEAEVSSLYARCRYLLSAIICKFQMQENGRATIFGKRVLKHRKELFYL